MVHRGLCRLTRLGGGGGVWCSAPPGLSEASGPVSRRGRRCLWFTSEFCEQICRQQQKLAGNRRRRHPQHRPRTQEAPKRRLQSSGSAGAAQPHANVTTASAAHTVATSSPIEIFPPAHPVSCGDARRAARTYAAGSGGGREQRAGGRADHGKQQQQTRSHVRAAGVGEGGWAGPGSREAEAQCASPGPPPTPAAAGRRGCGVNPQPNHS